MSNGKFATVVCALLTVCLSGVAFWSESVEQAHQPTLSSQLVSQTVPVANAAWQEVLHPTGKPDVTRDSAHPLDPAIELARKVLAHLNNDIDDYTATLIKRERINGSLGAETKIQVKIRGRKVQGSKTIRPLEVYLKFSEPWLSRGREVIWSEAKRDGKLVAHEGGFKNLARVTLNPTDQLAMLGNKYPITEIGLARLVEKLVEKGERDKLAGTCDVQFIDHQKVGDRACQLIQVTHAKSDPRFDFHIAQIFIDRERLIPLRYAAFLWPKSPGAEPPLEEEYTYINVQLNVGLRDADFDPENQAYSFP